MKIDLFKLNNFNHLDIDSDIEIDKSIYENTDIREIKKCHIIGSLDINYEDELIANFQVSGEFILPCAVSLDDVSYEFKTEIEENLGNFDNFYDKNKNSLDILPFIWENIVSEVPIRVVKEGVVPQNIVGDGWELVSSEESY